MSEPAPFAVDGIPLGEGHPCRVIAEVGVNHDGSPDRALALVEAAADAGADIVKFQVFRAAGFIAAGAPKASYQEARGVPGTDQREMVAAYELPPEAFLSLRDACRRRGVGFLCTPFEEESLRLVVRRLKGTALKIGSDGVTNLPFLREAARTGLPILLSTGMSTFGEVERAVATLEAAGARALLVMQCTSNYPASLQNANLRVLAAYREAFGHPVGLSDHTPGTLVAALASALGACAIEKHLTLDRSAPGPDHAASLDPAGFADLVRAVRDARSALGTGRKEVALEEIPVRQAARRSLVYARDLPRGAVLAAGDLVAKRPGTGLPPDAAEWVVGRTLAGPVRADTLVQREDLA